MDDVLLLSRYERLGASSRLRSYQYLPALERNGIRVRVKPLLDDRYLEARHRGRRPLSSVLDAYARRARDLVAAPREPILWIEYEALPWLPYAVERAFIGDRGAVVVDYDDAIFHRYDQHRSALVRGLLGRKIDQIMAAADVVVAGNEYLAARARQAGARRIEILPTVIDLSKYRQKVTATDEVLSVGWIGSPATTNYLRSLEPALRAAAAMRRIRVINVGGTPWHPDGFDVLNLPWSEATEVDDILRFDVGIMPLADDPWSRGKCGFKLIQYMGCGLPTIASPVGANATIVDDGVTGLLASGTDDWIRAIVQLADDAALRRDMGAAGLSRVRASYCLDATTPRLVALFRELLSVPKRQQPPR